MGGGIGETVALTSGQQKGGEGGYRVVSADRDRETFCASSDNTGVLKKLIKWQADVGAFYFS